MSPDSSAFAYALEYRRWHAGPFRRPADAHVEFWTFDLAHRRGPQQIASWSHEHDRTLRAVGWTADGLLIESRGGGGGAAWEWLDPTTGARTLALAPRDTPRPIRTVQDTRDEERRVPHVEEVHGEFALWDPVAFRLVPLFSLPVDSALAATGWDTSLRDREAKRLRDGLQDFAALDATSSARGLSVRIRTFAKRPLPIVRKYRLRLEYIVFRADPDTVGPLPALFDTTIAPDPAGATITFHVPARRFRTAPEYKLWHRPHLHFAGSLECTLTPVSLADSEMAVGRDLGYANRRDFSATVPIPGEPDEPGNDP